MATYFGGKYNLSLFVISFKIEDFAVNFPNFIQNQNSTVKE